MSVAAPWFLYAAAVGAAAVAGLHFLVTRPPPSTMLPTARFVPASAATLVNWGKRPSDLWLLMLRIALLGLVGTAFARPRLTPARASLLRIVVADRSQAVGEIAEVRDSVRRVLRTNDVLIVFDSVAHIVPASTAADTMSALARRDVRGVLSTALVAATRAAAGRRDQADSIELDLVSPFTDGELDAGAAAVRALWGDMQRGESVHVVRVSAARSSEDARRLDMATAADDDPLRAVLRVRAMMRRPGAATVRVVRSLATAADSAWARGGTGDAGADSGRTLVHWPSLDARPAWISRSPADTVGAVAVFHPAAHALVTPMERRWRLPVGRGTRVVARWVDGEAAAVERPWGEGCIRDVAIPVSGLGDVVLRPDFDHLVRAMLAPCGGESPRLRALAPDEVRAFEHQGPPPRTRTAAGGPSSHVPLRPWLLGLALIVTLIELAVRAPTRVPVEHGSESPS